MDRVYLYGGVKYFLWNYACVNFPCGHLNILFYAFSIFLNKLSLIYMVLMCFEVLWELLSGSLTLWMTSCSPMCSWSGRVPCWPLGGLGACHSWVVGEFYSLASSLAVCPQFVNTCQFDQQACREEVSSIVNRWTTIETSPGCHNRWPWIEQPQHVGCKVTEDSHLIMNDCLIMELDPGPLCEGLLGEIVMC